MTAGLETWSSQQAAQQGAETLPHSSIGPAPSRRHSLSESVCLSSPLCLYVLGEGGPSEPGRFQGLPEAWLFASLHDGLFHLSLEQWFLTFLTL